MSDTDQDMGFNVLEKRIYDQNQLLHISKALNSKLNLSFLIETILDISLAQSQTMQIGIYLYPEVGQSDFALHYHHIGFDIEDSSDFVISEKNSIIQYLQNAKGPVNLNELKTLMLTMKEDFKTAVSQLAKLSEKLLIAPLRSKSKINGLIVLGPKVSGEEYAPHEKTFLQDLASIAAIAVANAGLYELATVDMMTKLKMHHFFQNKLRENISLKEEEDQLEFSIFLTDIDHFKKFNDTYGHQLGDLVLKQVAQVMIDNCHEQDIPCRYGGEEFVVILPGTGIDEAASSAERLRKAIEELEVPNPTDVGEKILKVTISAGVAEYNAAVDKEPKMMIERCDKGLYKAKHGGRNQVVRAGVF